MRSIHVYGGDFVIRTPGRSPLGLGPPYWSFKYYELKIHICGMCDLNSRPLTYESVVFTQSHTSSATSFLNPVKFFLFNIFSLF